MADPVIEFSRLTKRFGPVLAVDDLSFTVQPGTVTGFLGPNGAGKTTTLRMLLGLVRPTGGTALIGGRAYRDLDHPIRVVGAVLESSGFHPGRTARNHLLAIATACGVDHRRVDEMLSLVGLADAADRRVGGYSMGMRQRLELARAMLGDPQVLVLDEPANGLDPQGIAWLRSFLRYLASEGRIVLISSHLLAEAAQTVDHVVVLSNGRLAGQGPLEALLAARTTSVRVRTPDAARLAEALGRAGVATHAEGPDTVVAQAATPEQVGRLMAEERVVVLEMTASGDSLESLFFSMTDEAGSRSPQFAPPPPPPPPASEAAAR